MTDTTRQTPGPWRLTQVHTPEDDYGNWYFRINAGKGFHDDDQQGFELTGIINPKDAHIAAAAPELNEALIAADGLLRDLGHSLPQVKAALAKARGAA